VVLARVVLGKGVLNRHEAEVPSDRADRRDPVRRHRRGEARPAAPPEAGADSPAALERQRVVKPRAQRPQLFVAALRMNAVGEQHGVAILFPVNPE